MMVRLEEAGARLYFLGDTFAVKDRLKALGAHWSQDRRAWWIGKTKRAAAEALLAEIAQPVATATAGSAAAADRVGLDKDAPAAVVADRLEEQGRSREAERVRAGGHAQRPAHDVRLSGKGTYEGRSYFLGPQTRDGAKVLILGLPRDDGSYFERWVPVAEVEVTKTYQARQVWDGRRYSGRTVAQHTTLGSIADFVRREQANRRAGGAVCAECGTSGDLVRDMEDGLLKHRHCCDMEP